MILMICVIFAATMMSGCLDGEPIEIARIEIVRVHDAPSEYLDDSPPTPCPDQDMQVKHTVEIRFKTEVDGTEYAATLKLYNSGQASMYMRSETGNLIWHANWEVIDRQQGVICYNIVGRDGTVAIFSDGMAGYVTSDETILGTWSDESWRD